MFETVILAVSLMHSQPQAPPQPGIVPYVKAAPVSTPSPCASSIGPDGKIIAPVPSPTPISTTCDGWVSGGWPDVHTQNSPQNAVSPTPRPATIPNMNGSISVAENLKFQASGYDRTPGNFLSATNAVDKLTIPDYAFGNNWFACSLCQPITGQNQPLASQARLAPQNGPGVPPQAQLFSTVMDLTKLAPATWSAALVSNLDPWVEQKHNAGVAGLAQGYTAATNTYFSDGYFEYQISPFAVGDPKSNQTVQLSLAGAETNHQAPTSFTHATDWVGSAIYDWSNGNTAIAAITQFGTQGMAGGQTFNLLLDLNTSNTPSPSLKAQTTQGLNPWDPVLERTSQLTI